MTEDPEPRSTFVIIGILLVSFLVFLFVVLLWVHPGRATEYLQIERDDVVYCDQYAKRAAISVADIVQAYADCISILPTRLPMPEPPGTVPAAGETWSEACEREYRTWDAATGTVVRRGSPDRVECPLVLKDGEWIVPTQ